MECKDRRLLMIVNPCAGRRLGLRRLPKLHRYFESVGFLVTDYVTQCRGDAIEVAMRAESYDIIVCVGGDGTLNEVICGLRRAELERPLGYIPTGSTNDFARSLGIPRKPLRAAHMIAEGDVLELDIGRFEDRSFSYIASFGDLVRSSYSAPQKLKNLFGHAAYLFGGIADVATMRPYHVRIDSPDMTVEDDFIFGAVSNSTSVAGIIRIDRELVDFSDGKLEVLLVRQPKTPKQITHLLRALALRKFDNSDRIVFFHTNELTVTAPEHMPWTLDGEKAEGKETLHISCEAGAVRLVGKTAEHRSL